MQLLATIYTPPAAYTYAERLDALEKRCGKMELDHQSALNDLECLRYQVADSQAWHLLDKFIDCSVVNPGSRNEKGDTSEGSRKDKGDSPETSDM